MRELTLDDLLALGPKLRRFLPKDVRAVWLIGSGSLVFAQPEVPADLRTSRDVDVVPIGVPVLYLDSQIMERELGENSLFADEHRFFVDYVTPDLLRCTPPGWQERVRVIELAAGLAGHCLDPHDVAYNKLWAGRPKDILWVRRLIATGLISMERLKVMHNGNPIPLEDHQKVSRSMLQVEQPVD